MNDDIISALDELHTEATLLRADVKRVADQSHLLRRLVALMIVFVLGGVIFGVVTFRTREADQRRDDRAACVRGNELRQQVSDLADAVSGIVDSAIHPEAFPEERRAAAEKFLADTHARLQAAKPSLRSCDE